MDASISVLPHSVRFQVSALRSPMSGLFLPRPKGTRVSHPCVSLQGTTCGRTISVLPHSVKFQLSGLRLSLQHWSERIINQLRSEIGA